MRALLVALMLVSLAVVPLAAAEPDCIDDPNKVGCAIREGGDALDRVADKYDELRQQYLCFYVTDYPFCLV